MFKEGENFPVKGRETLDESETVTLEIESMEFEKLHPVPEKVETQEKFKKGEERRRSKTHDDSRNRSG